MFVLYPRGVWGIYVPPVTVVPGCAGASMRCEVLSELAEDGSFYVRILDDDDEHERVKFQMMLKSVQLKVAKSCVVSNRREVAHDMSPFRCRRGGRVNFWSAPEISGRRHLKTKQGKNTTGTEKLLTAVCRRSSASV